MSTPIAEIIQQAYRESNLIAVGVNPTAAEETEALRRLQSIIKATIGSEAGEELEAWEVPARSPVYRGVGDTATSPWPNSRLLVQLSAPTTIEMPVRGLRDGARMAVQDQLGNFATHNLTLDGNGYLVDGSATKVLNTNSANVEYFFRADLGAWVLVSALEIDDDMPFPADFDELFVAMLNMRLNPRHSTATRQETAVTIQAGLDKLRARYRQKMAAPAEIGLTRLSRQAFGSGFSFGAPEQ